MRDDNRSFRSYIKDAFIKEVEKGEMLFYEGSHVEYVPFVIDGELKIYILSDTGREILLYNVLPDRFCIFAMLSVMSENDYPAYTVAGKDSKIVSIPSDLAIRWLDSDVEWRRMFLYLLTLL